MESLALRSLSLSTSSSASYLSLRRSSSKSFSLLPPLISVHSPPTLRSLSISSPRFTLRATASSSPEKPQSLPSPSPPQPQGAKLIPLTISISTGLIVRFLIPRPEQVTSQGWQLLSIFLFTISGLVLGPLPVGAWAFIGLTASIVTKTLPFSTAFAAFTNELIWLIAISFFFARGFIKTGLGDRIATYFVKWLGKSTLGLSYGLAFCETLMGLIMPSTMARAGGVFLPVIKSLALSAGSYPGDPSSRKLGSFLIQTQLQCSGASGAILLTSAAQNLLCLKLAREVGVVISNPWITWFKVASVPAFVSLLCTPLIIYKLYPPELKHTPEAPAAAAKKLEQLGPITKNEWIMLGAMAFTVSLWVFGEAIGISSVVSAMIGLSTLLLLGVINWDDCLSDKSAWDSLTWFAVLIGMAGQLTNLGVVAWMSDCVAKLLQSLSLTWPASFIILQACYLLIHYLFASQTAHAGALYPPFLAMQIAAGVPGVLAALCLAFNNNLSGALAHYSGGPAALYYGAGYVDLRDMFRVGFVMALVQAIIWGGVGSFWWKFLGLY
ncbi:Solute carrier family 13 [Arabidopsis thaliana x Arabidopsis arenosa]|uniref:Solute carrier family 13 n=1 Tax=Arabidopsis thaliana x Arabidopsis arenosa TaxID=1240361 RepID=A0A8T1XSB2_9BRAS|nr:Solute carrier family 13 [Arabidopsis thaliana x Arabidopsis arenosa]